MAANGGKLTNDGRVCVDAYTQEGHHEHIEFENVKLDLPILSTKKYAQGGKKILYEEDGGIVYNPVNGNISTFISTDDV